MGKLRSSAGHKIISIIIAILVISLGSGIALAMNQGMDNIPIKKFFSGGNTNAVWDWSNISNHNTRELSETAEFLYMHQINAVFVDISAYYDLHTISDDGEKEKQISQYKNSISQYISAMDKRNIRVFAAAGHTDWSKVENQKIPLTIQDFVQDYNQNNQYKFAGMEFDVESYNQSHFAEASFTEKELVLNEFLDMMDALASDHEKYVKESQQNEFELGFAIPYWFDNQNQNIKSVTWKDKTGPVLFHLLDRLNYLNRSNVVVMAYRNAALGNDGMIYHSRTEIEYARSKAQNVDILIGIEVNDVEPEKITFFGRSLTELSSEVDKLNMEFDDNSPFGGTAINDLAGYRIMEEDNR